MQGNLCSELASILQQIENGDQPRPGMPLPSYKYPIEFMKRMEGGSINEIMQTIYSLREDFRRVDLRNEIDQPYISIVLSYAYCKINRIYRATSYAKIASHQFYRLTDQWDRAMSHWFLGIIYKYLNLYDDAENELRESLKILNAHFLVAQEKYNYNLVGLCNQQSDVIKTTIKEIHHLKTHLHTQEKSVISHEGFSEVIVQLQVPQDDWYLDWLHAMSSMDTSDVGYIHSQVDLLLSILEEKEETEPFDISFVKILLSHCFNYFYLLGDEQAITEALDYAEDAYGLFQSIKDVHNQIIILLYLSLLYRNTSENQTSLECLREADNLIEEFAEAYTNTILYEEILELRSDIRFWTNPSKHQAKTKQEQVANKTLRQSKNEETHAKRNFFFPWSKSPQSAQTTREVSSPKSSRKKNGDPSPDSTSFRINRNVTERPHLVPRDRNGNPPSQNEPPDGGRGLPTGKKDKPQVEHIIIPVDLRALKDTNPKLYPLDDEIYEELQQYEEKIVSKNEYATSISGPKTTYLKPVIIPRIPLYGQVAAGPSGEPSLNSPVGMVEAVNNDIYIHIEGQKFEVMFINIEQFNFKNDGCYGWLQVVGHSMNNSDPLPINNGDYVLFSENRLASQCVHKIVVAGLPETNSDFLLVVKRLLREAKSSPERPIYILHSESSKNHDLKSGKSYKQDIKISNDNQLVGEVIAIAKPI